MTATIKDIAEARSAITDVMEKIKAIAPDAETFISAYEKLTFEYPDQDKLIAFQKITEVREYGHILYAMMNDLKVADPHLAPLLIKEIHETVFREQKAS